MTIPINSNLEQVFEKYLNILNPMLGHKQMKPLELKILSKLLYVRYSLNYLSADKVNSILFSSKLKKNIRKSLLDMSEASYNNIILSLRKKELIKYNKLNMVVPIKDGKIEINILIKITDDTGNI